MGTKQSVYVIVKSDDQAVIIGNRKDLADGLKKIGSKKVKAIYRSIKMEFQKIETVRLIAVKNEEEETTDGPPDDQKNSD